MTTQVRPYELADVDPFLEAAVESIREVSAWLPWCHAGYCRAEAEAWIAMQVQRWQSREEFQFVIVSPSGRLLGGCGINQINTEHRFANLGYWVRSSATGAGVATAAVGLVRDWAFANTDLERLELVVACGNTSSERVAEKAGAVREGMLRARVILHGRILDASLYSFVRADAQRGS